MTQFTPGLILEFLLVALLLVTVAYCVVLNRRLSKLKDSQHELREIVTDLSQATFAAENAIRGLRSTTDDAEARLSDKLAKAEEMSRELSAFERPAHLRAAPPVDTAPVPKPAAPRQVVRPVAPVVSDRHETPVVGAGQAAPTTSREVWRQHALSRLNRAS